LQPWFRANGYSDYGAPEFLADQRLLPTEAQREFIVLRRRKNPHGSYLIPRYGDWTRTNVATLGFHDLDEAVDLLQAMKRAALAFQRKKFGRAQAEKLSFHTLGHGAGSTAVYWLHLRMHGGGVKVDEVMEVLNEEKKEQKKGEALKFMRSPPLAMNSQRPAKRTPPPKDRDFFLQLMIFSPFRGGCAKNPFFRVFTPNS